jgi:hypothetical protein
MTPESMILAAKNQQDRTGRKDAAVTFIIGGSWPTGGTKKLAGKIGPKGRCLVEYEDAVLCEFKADAVIAFCSKLIPRLTLRMAAKPAP